MHYYTKNIADFNNATRHLTRQERSIYSDLIELQYDLETPLPDDLDWICRRILATSESERTDVERMLNEYFEQVEQGWSNARCEHEIEKFRNKSEKARAAGKASGEARKRNKKPNKNKDKKSDEQTLNKRSADVELTNNHKPITNNRPKSNSDSGDSQPDTESQRDKSLAMMMFQKIKSVTPKAKEPNFDKWADSIRLMRERDELTRGEIWGVFQWANQDDFWSTNILSPSKLREQFPRLAALANKSSREPQQEVRASL